MLRSIGFGIKAALAGLLLEAATRTQPLQDSLIRTVNEQLRKTEEKNHVERERKIRSNRHASKMRSRAWRWQRGILHSPCITLDQKHKLLYGKEI